MKTVGCKLFNEIAKKVVINCYHECMSDKAKTNNCSADQRDFSIVAETTVETEANTKEHEEYADEGKNPAAVALGKLGGKKGGMARAKKLSPERRKEIAQKAARARWNRKKKESDKK